MIPASRVSLPETRMLSCLQPEDYLKTLGGEDVLVFAVKIGGEVKVVMYTDLRPCKGSI